MKLYAVDISTESTTAVTDIMTDAQGRGVSLKCLTTHGTDYIFDIDARYITQFK